MRPRTTLHLLVVLAAVVLAVGLGAGATVAAQSLDNPADGPDPRDYDEDDPAAAYDRGNYQLTLTSANGTSLDYELGFIGAVEPADDRAEGTVECIGEFCFVEGEVEPEEEVTYNASGMLLSVTPDRNLTVAVQGSFDGDAAIGLGWGQAEGDDELDDGTPDGDVGLDEGPDDRPPA